MNKQEATQFIQQVFQSPFNEQRFGRFAAELLNEIEAKPFSYSGPYIKDAYKQYVQQYKRIGTYTDPSGDEVDILIVHLKQGTTLERARTMQRNFIAHYLRDRGDRDAALVAYYSDDEPDWRFSLVRMAYQRVQDEASGKIKVVEELTPARRYSFLVGETEPSHTAQQQFITLLTEERSNPTLDDLEAAFNLETVTKEFFEKYKGLFLRLYEALDGLARINPTVRAEFTTKALDTRHFAKKLLGQIVFLYFLQKKGWLGVQPGAAWGSGPKDFLRRLFDGQWGGYTNFFNERLEPLFYAALARQRPDNHYAPLGCQIPFLNGGLFEPLQGYDWQGVDILLDNELFAAIFDTFDLYNFTVRENEPLEKEVAVDPEMLGKVFENLLEVTDRKSKGAFYTPREIVQYMCQESLINYLDTALNRQEVPVVAEAPTQATLFGDTPPHQATLTTWARRERVPREELAKLIRKGEQVKEFEAAKESGTKAYTYQLAEALRRHAGLLDEALASIKICDPAIGSGAFPVGMMQEIVRAREVLTSYLGDNTLRTAYAFKRHAIQESIYGVDIDPGAVDIAKLRLWLSLVVDEEDYRTIKPLPNLDYKIVRGNSLLGYPFKSRNTQEIERWKREYFDVTNPSQKRILREKIDERINGIYVNSAKALGYKVNFDFQINFSEVFDQKGGFDIAIGNPPYVRADGDEAYLAMRRAIESSGEYDTLWEKWDLYVAFIEKGYKLLRPQGTTTMIVSDAYCHAKYAIKSQKWFLKNSLIERLDFLSKIKIFDAEVHNVIYFFKKADGQQNIPLRCVHYPKFGDILQLPSDRQSNLNYRVFFPEEKTVQQFTVETIPLERICYISKGMAVHAHEDRAPGAFKLGDLVADSMDDIHSKPFVEGKHLARWMPLTHKWLEWDTQRAPALFSRPTFPEMYSVYEKLISIDMAAGTEQLCVTYDNRQLIHNHSAWSFLPWHTLSGIYNSSIKKTARYAYEKSTNPNLPKREMLEEISKQFLVKYLLAVMNSTIAREYLRANRRSNLHLYPDDWKKLPIPDVSLEQQQPIVEIVDRILDMKSANLKADISTLEEKLDNLVAQLYGVELD